MHINKETKRRMKRKMTSVKLDKNNAENFWKIIENNRHDKNNMQEDAESENWVSRNSSRSIEIINRMFSARISKHN